MRMNFVRNQALGVALVCAAVSAGAIPVTFENLLVSASIPINPIANDLGDADSFNDLSFATWGDNGLTRGLYTGTNSSIVDIFPTNNLDNTSTKALFLAPNAGQVTSTAGAFNVPYTEMSFAALGQSLTGKFSFQYATGRGVTVQFFNGSSQFGTSSLLPSTATNGTTWATFEQDFATNTITSVRFFAQNNPVSPDLPKDNVFIDNMSINYSQSAMVPEPSTYAAMILGLFGIGFVARRRMAEA
jgi:hypothetical protein